MLAVSRVAGIVSGASPAYNVEEMTYALKKGRAKYLFTVPGSMGVAEEAAKAAGLKKEHVFLLEGEYGGFKSMQELLEIGRNEKVQVPEYRLAKGEKNGDLCGFLSFTSGTTGLPKAVSACRFISISISISVSVSIVKSGLERMARLFYPRNRDTECFSKLILAYADFWPNTDMRQNSA